jgi:hypothetical protein
VKSTRGKRLAEDKQYVLMQWTTNSWANLIFCPKCFSMRQELNQVQNMMSRKKGQMGKGATTNGASIPSPSTRKCIFQRILLLKGSRWGTPERRIGLMVPCNGFHMWEKK